MPSLVVSETVQLVKDKLGPLVSGFANAVLRKISLHADSWRALPYNLTATSNETAKWANLPEWIWKKLVTQKGETWVRNYAITLLERPELWFREKGEFTLPQVLKDSKLDELAGFQDGKILVQDISNQLLVSEVSQILKKAGKKTVLDLCASPGGKSVGLSWNGFQVDAHDRAGHRFEKLEENLKRLSPEVKTLTAPDLETKTWDAVWVDAPCTSSGLFRRHPEIRWIRKEEQVQDLGKLQKELLEKGLSHLNSGGYLIYSVCSIFKEEGDGLLVSF